ncbi:MAG: carboxypeptidase M32 [Pseudomonadota bacterium]
MTNAYEALIEHAKQTAALEQASQVLHWDQMTQMPERGAAQRAASASALEAAIHNRKADPRVSEWLDLLADRSLAAPAARNVALIRREHARATRVPEALAAAIATASSEGYTAWTAARESGAFADFVPALSHMVSLTREQADHLADDGQSRYDALLALYEPGAKADILLPLLETLREPLSLLREELVDSPPPGQLTGPFPAEDQIALSREVALALGYDMTSGRLDLTVHPFCSGVGGDVRITTRVQEDNPLDCLYSVIHETGHALYAQNAPLDRIMEPSAQYASMGVHESQSRLLENQIGRSRAFAEWIFPRFIETYGTGSVASPEALYAALNRVETGFIRTEADEVHYNLHILLRAGLERDLIDGQLEVDALEDAWNTQFAADFGKTVPDAVSGVLQDVHWSQGAFGYFPTYSLGNLYAAGLAEAMRGALPDMDAQIATGDFAPIVDWLRQNVHAHANAEDPEQLMTRAMGQPLSTAPFLSYVTTKFRDLHNL